MSTLAERLIEARSDKGWKKSDLKREAKIKSFSTLTELENGMRTESPQLPKIAAALGVSVMWLQHDIGPKYANVIDGESRRVEEIDPIPALTVPFQSARDRQINELVTLARSMSDEGLLRLLGVASENAKQYPAQAKQTPGSFQ